MTEITFATLCRICGEFTLEKFLDLGLSPLVDKLLTAAQLQEPEARFPLEIAFCHHCHLVQALGTIPSNIAFADDYGYFSSISAALQNNARENVSEVLRVRPLSPQSFVLEIGSNDGYLLQNYQAAGIPCLGIEPASGPTRVALEKGIPTLGEFFTLELAQNLADKGIRADVIHVNDVLPFVADVDGFVAGMALLLKESGVAVIEVLYWGNVVENCEIGSINHLHYFSLHSLSFLFRKHGLFPRSVKIVPVIGGSLRLFLTKDDHPDDSILELLEAEEQQGMHRLDYALNYARNLLGMKHSLLNLLREIKRQGKRIAAYGAGAKGITLLNFLEIAPGMINFVVDSQPRKQGLYLPGVHVKINSPEKLLEAMPDYVLILAWNFAQEIMAGQQEYQQRGGNFIIPLPTPKIIYGVPQ